MPSGRDPKDLFDPWGIAFKEPSELVIQRKGVAGAPVAPMAILLMDNFNDVNGTLLPAHVMDVGPGWVKVGAANFDTQTNTAQPASDLDGDQVQVEGTVANGYLFCTVYAQYTSANNAERPGLLFRWSDATHYWLVECAFDVDLVNLYKRNGGAPILVDSQPCSFASGTAQDVRVNLAGTEIHVHVGGVVSLQASDAFNVAATKYGLYLTKVGAPGGVCTWDTFVLMG